MQTSTPTPVNAPIRWIITGVLALIALIGVYLLAICTRTGQAWENAALRGADQVDPETLDTARNDLGEITTYTLAGAILLVGVVGLLRRRVDLAVAGMGLIIVGLGITEVLKRFVLVRPELLETSGHYAHNSFPSGHTTIAMTVLLALLIVVPYRWRGVTMFFATLYALGIGAQTVTAKWHRVSDTLGADAVALLCACAVSWWLMRRGRIIRHTGRPLVSRTIIVTFWALALAFVGAAGAIILDATANQGDPAQFDATALDNAYLAANALAIAGSIATLLIFWGLWRRLEIPAKSTGTTPIPDQEPAGWPVHAGHL
ncbi:phosphatase PAP2 family protein [Actinokineospora alba]|uniref:phosphatase PAP2 family protein n=1 Tax=Actinokineospora alba TaxID=504798 RepID=UPI001E5983E9|nr:phosphatase PAP2 family protein [Actinokineospora alba]